MKAQISFRSWGIVVTGFNGTRQYNTPHDNLFNYLVVVFAWATIWRSFLDASSVHRTFQIRIKEQSHFTTFSLMADLTTHNWNLHYILSPKKGGKKKERKKNVTPWNTMGISPILRRIYLFLKLQVRLLLTFLHAKYWP